MAMPSFTATIGILGVNPYVLVPKRHLENLFEAAGRDRGPFPITVNLAGKSYKQTLVRFQGDWRLYLNTPMRKVANKQVGDRVALTVEYDPLPRIERMPTIVTVCRNALGAPRLARTTARTCPSTRAAHTPCCTNRSGATSSPSTRTTCALVATTGCKRPDPQNTNDGFRTTIHSLILARFKRGFACAGKLGTPSALALLGAEAMAWGSTWSSGR